MTTLEQVREDVLTECADDYFGLWSILWRVRNLTGEADPAVRRRQTLELVRSLLESGRVRAGFPTPDGAGFRPWTLSPAEAVARIAAEWDALGREPNVGDIVWFTTPEPTTVS